jgi:hypothetical protein
MLDLKFCALDPKYKDVLNTLQERAKSHVFTKEELFEQRVSFVYSSVFGKMSKDTVRQMLKEQAVRA